MIIAYILGAMFSVGCIGGTIYFAISCMLDDDIAMGSVILLIGLPFMALLATLPWVAFESSKSPVLATLTKDQWQCTHSHPVTTMVMVGKVMVPQINQVCDAYSAK